MVAYMIIDLDVHDEAAFKGYQKSVPVIIAKHGTSTGHHRNRCGGNALVNRCPLKLLLFFEIWPAQLAIGFWPV